jgi:hypothetical protein
MSRRRLLDEVDSAELTDWLAMEQEYGLGDGHFLAGVLAPVIAAGYSKKARTAADFVPYFSKAGSGSGSGKQTTDEMLGRFRTVSDRLKGRI